MGQKSKLTWWMWPLTGVLVLPLTVVIQHYTNWMPGLATLLLMAWPVCVSGLSGRTRIAAITAALACFGLVVEVVFAAPLATGRKPADFGFLMAVAVIFPACSLSTAAHIRRWQQHLDAFHRRSHEYLSELCDPYQRNPAGMPLEIDARMQASLEKHSPEDLCQSLAELDPHAPLLYITLQEIGRRVSTDLDLATLLPTIESTACKLLRCEQSEIYFWNSQTKQLTAALPHPEAGPRFIPSTTDFLTEWVLQERQVLTRQIILQDPRFEGWDLDPDALPDAIAPLTVGNELLGLMVLHKVEEESPLFLRLLYILTNISALGIKNAQMFRRMEEQARRDGMTGLLNRASFEEQLQQTVVHARATGQLLTLIMSDVDHFKHFNDTHGHPAGDEVLRTVARIWQRLAPQDALIGRYGGEEFICAVPGLSLERGIEFAEAVRQTIQDVPVSYEGQPLNVTASFGVAELTQELGQAKELIRDADVALYRSKHAGRNRVSCAAHSRLPVNSTEMETPLQPAPAVAR